MEKATKVTVVIKDKEDTTWERFRNGEHTRGTTKKDKIFLQQVISALEEALYQARGELTVIS